MILRLIGYSIRQWMKSFLLIDLLKGLGVTLRYLFKPKFTIQYPEAQTPKSNRFRGLHALRRYENGEERCIACKLCEAVCPALAISIDSVEQADGTRRTSKYEIDLFKCIFCGFCEEACPVDAIVEMNESNFTIHERGQNILDKDKLLALGDHYETVIAKAREKK